VLFFLDEIDTTDWKVIKILNPLIEEFEINGKKIRPFIFASATINKDILIKNNPDTLDRIPHHIQFTRYSAEDINKIITQYKKQLYPDDNVSEKDILDIAKNCKFNPRTAISILESHIVENNIKQVLKSNKIIKDGLTSLDVKILQILSQATRPMGANAVALRVGLSPNQYLREFEPFLYEFGYIARVPSRIITEKGKTFLKSLSKGNIK
jgi:Holliday junction resolvasome RuvABC ATP-dependent DNA helicase subunit